MKKKSIIIMWVAAMFFSLNIMAQSNWTPTRQITGYVNAMAEWTDLSTMVDIGDDIGVGLAEVGFLASYRPLEKLELKTTLVYTHNMVNFQDMLVEAYGKYTFNKGFSVSAGKFLTPLSPANVYFFAPVNPSGVLPMVLSHHFLTPQSISGLQISGEFGETINFGYNLTYGSYTTVGHIKQGIIGLVGAEDQNTASFGAIMENEKQNYDLGGSARVYAGFNDIVSLGLNYFQGTRATLAYGMINIETPQNSTKYGYSKSRKQSVGLDFHLDFNGMVKFNAEYWQGNNTAIDPENELELNLKGYYAEAIFNKGWFSPYLRYEYLEDWKVLGIVTNDAGDFLGEDVGEIKVSSMGGGLAIRPLYEVMLKLDYRHINSTPSASLENGAGVSMEKYNHFVASVIISF